LRLAAVAAQRTRQAEMGGVGGGRVLEMNLVQGMESLLDAKTITYPKTVRMMEELKETLVGGVNPFTLLIDEEAHLTPKVTLFHNSKMDIFEIKDPCLYTKMDIFQIKDPCLYTKMDIFEIM
jgi:hypothetical protein